MSFQKEQIQRARQADLVEYLRARGYELKREGQNFRVPGHGGLIVRGNHWRQFSTGEGGNSLDFLVKVLGVEFKKAVEQLVNCPAVNPGEQSMSGGTTSRTKQLDMPARAQNQRRVIAYLTQTRGLPADLVVGLIRAGLLWQDARGNCVFPCLDSVGQAQGAILEGTLSDVRWKGRAAGSDIHYGWLWPPAIESDLVAVVESPIDAMSLSVLRPGVRSNYLLALGGLHFEAVERFLSERLHVRQVVLAMDNDSPGRQAAQDWQKWLNTQQYKVWCLFPDKGKDWNEMVKAARRS